MFTFRIDIPNFPPLVIERNKEPWSLKHLRYIPIGRFFKNDQPMLSCFRTNVPSPPLTYTDPLPNIRRSIMGEFTESRRKFSPNLLMCHKLF